MAEDFEPITSQEQFDARIKERIARAAKSAREAYDREHAEDLEKARAYDELQEQSKSELQRAMDRASDAEAKLERLESEARRRDIADEVSRETGVPAHLLRGATKEDMESSAREISEFAEARRPPVVASEGRRPKSDAPSTNADLFAQLIGGN